MKSYNNKLKNPITKENVLILMIVILLFSAWKIYEEPDILNLKEPDEISNEELLEKSLDVTEKGLDVLNRFLAVEGLWSSMIAGLLIAVAIFLGLELRKKKKSHTK